MGVLDIKVNGFTKNIKVHPLWTMITHNECHENSVIHFGIYLALDRQNDQYANTVLLSNRL